MSNAEKDIVAFIINANVTYVRPIVVYVAKRELRGNVQGSIVRVGKR